MKIQNYHLLFQAVVGSHSHGTNVEGSDIDRKGVYIQTPKDILYDGYKPQIEVGKDETYYELRRFLELCEKANPTVLELLYSPWDCIEYQHVCFDTIVEHRSIFLTKKCRLSFGGYAVEQIIKAKGLQKKMNWENERIIRRDILDFCFVHEGCGSTPVKDYLRMKGIGQDKAALVRLPHMKDCYAMYFDEGKTFQWTEVPKGIARDIFESNDVSLSSIPKEVATFGIPSMLYFNKDAYSTHCREYNEYLNWLRNRNTQRYVDIKNHNQKIDGKNMLHCVRLIETALEIPEQKEINVRRQNTDYLKSIRKGEVDLNTLITKCEKDIVTLDSSFITSDLPDEVEKTFTKNLIITVREQFEKSNG